MNIFYFYSTSIFKVSVQFFDKKYSNIFIKSMISIKNFLVVKEYICEYLLY